MGGVAGTAGAGAAGAIAAGSAFGPIGTAAALAGTALSAYSSYEQGQGTAAADQMKADELARKAQIGQAAAVEANANMTQRLNQSLGNIDAVRAAEHGSAASPTTAALRSTTAALANEDRIIKVGNILSQSEEDTASSDYEKQAGAFAMTQGDLSALAGAANTIGKTNFSGFGLGSPPYAGTPV